MGQSTRKPPRKPHPEFPLYAHQSGQWAKKIHGKTRYFGAWDAPDLALERWLAEKDDLLAGRAPVIEAFTLADLCNAFLHAKEDERNFGDVGERHFRQLIKTAKGLTSEFGRSRPVASLRPDDFARLKSSLQRRLGPVALRNELTRIRSIFNWGVANALLERQPAFGSGFKVSQRQLRQARASAPARFFDAATICELLKAASSTMRAMILLGIGNGLGPGEVARLAPTHISGEWLNFPRPKTGIERRSWLWPETIEAIGAAQTSAPKGFGLMFATPRGNPWFRDDRQHLEVTKSFGRLLKMVGRPATGVNFNALRHTHRTIISSAGDPEAAAVIMGHASQQSGVQWHYIESEGFGDDRLIRCGQYVRNWLFSGDF